MKIYNKNIDYEFDKCFNTSHEISTKQLVIILLLSIFLCLSTIRISDPSEHNYGTLEANSVKVYDSETKHPGVQTIRMRSHDD